MVTCQHKQFPFEIGSDLPETLTRVDSIHRLLKYGLSGEKMKGKTLLGMGSDQKGWGQ